MYNRVSMLWFMLEIFLYIYIFEFDIFENFQPAAALQEWHMTHRQNAWFFLDRHPAIFNSISHIKMKYSRRYVFYSTVDFVKL